MPETDPTETVTAVTEVTTTETGTTVTGYDPSRVVVVVVLPGVNVRDGGVHAHH